MQRFIKEKNIQEKDIIAVTRTGDYPHFILTLVYFTEWSSDASQT